MKALIDLTIGDLSAHPLWRHFGGDDDKASVTPDEEFVSPNNTGYLAKTLFTTSSGKEFIGFCSPQDPSGIDYIQPVIILGNQHIRLWNEAEGCESDQKKIASLLGLELAETFPMQYKCLVPFEGQFWEDTIEVAR